ncbi:30230_t:CDS:2, partial [Racocetra persica]
GIRTIEYKNSGCQRSRMESCWIEFKILHSTLADTSGFKEHAFGKCTKTRIPLTVNLKTLGAQTNVLDFIEEVNTHIWTGDYINEVQVTNHVNYNPYEWMPVYNPYEWMPAYNPYEWMPVYNPYEWIPVYNPYNLQIQVIEDNIEAGYNIPYKLYCRDELQTLNSSQTNTSNLKTDVIECNTEEVYNFKPCRVELQKFGGSQINSSDLKIK